MRAAAADKLYRLKIQQREVQQELDKATFNLNSLCGGLPSESIPLAIPIKDTSDLLVVMAVHPLKTEIVPLEGQQP